MTGMIEREFKKRRKSPQEIFRELYTKTLIYGEAILVKYKDGSVEVI